MRAMIAIPTLLSAVACLGPLSGSSPAQAPGRPGPIVASGASFSEPMGWVRLVPDKAKTKGWFIGGDSDPKAPGRMIMVDIGKPAAGTLAEVAGLFARAWGGRVLEEKTTLDGVEALRVRVEKPGAGLRPVEGVLALKDGRLYSLMGGAEPGREVAGAVEEVREGWKWVE